MNSDMLNSLFTQEQQQAIRLTVNKNRDENDRGIKDSEDTLFLLSARQMRKYFRMNPQKLKAEPTAYAQARGCWTNVAGYCYYWLRTSTFDDGRGQYVSSSGETGWYSVTDRQRGVRPAMWIDLSDDSLGL